jgi:hypothetical protein
MRGRRNQDKVFSLVNPAGLRDIEAGKKSSDAALVYYPLGSLDMMLLHMGDEVSTYTYTYLYTCTYTYTYTLHK